ncbi:hypothetical protein BD770DRAFT_444069 [Pilaira anomala]|nr:hypothetical protein BD770DRAFT_444069 [Pilaira anomala]
MLFLKAFFITVLLFLGTAQCLENNEAIGKLTFTQVLEDFFRPSKEPTTYELLNNLVKDRVSNGLKDYKNSVSGLDMPEIKEALKDAGEYVVLQLDMFSSDVQSLMNDVKGTEVTLYGYRLGSPSDYNIENAARFFLLASCIRIVLFLMEAVLVLSKTSYSRLFY